MSKIVASMFMLHVLTSLGLLPQSFDDVQAGNLPEFPTIEWYFQTTVDESMQDEHGRHNSALFVQWCAPM